MGVQTLEILAFNAAYREITRNFLLCNHSPTEKQQFPCLPFSSILSSSSDPPLSTQEKISRVQTHLNYYLEGFMNDDIRSQFVKRFDEDGFKYKNPENDLHGGDDGQCIIDICSFLDSVLDKSFDQLKVVFPSGEPNPELISVIARRSPQLKELELNFFFCGATCIGKVETLMGSLSSLEKLTHLTLSSMADKLRQTFMSLVGKCCPLLTHLIIDGFPYWREGELEIQGLILGETLPDAGYSDGELNHLKVPAERLTPFCSTLRVLDYYNDCPDDEDVKYGAVSDSNVAFALRHLPFLNYLGTPVPTVLGIEKLCRIKADARSKLRLQQASQSQPAASELVLLRGQITNIPDFLLLTRLDDVYLLNSDQLRAIGAMCSNLEHVVFTMKTFVETDPYLSEYYPGATEADIDSTFLEDYSDTAGIESSLMDLLEDWPALTTIEFDTIYASIYPETVLKVFGFNLKNLTFHSLSNAPAIADLAPCICLESLVIPSAYCKLNKDSEPSTDLSADTFLPKLKHFTSGICLGASWSRLFEEKTSLVSLDLWCSHVGIGDEDASQASLEQQPNKRLKLNEEVSKAWQELETLTIRQKKGLSPTLLNLLPQLRKLKKVVLSTGIRKTTDPVLLNSVMEKLTQRVSPVQIDFVYYFHAYCPVSKKKK